MGDIESGQSQNDFEVQVSGLDELDTAANWSQPSHRSRKPVFSPYQRRVYLILLNCLMILAVVFILANTTSVRDLVSSVFIHPTPSPTATLVPGVDLFYVQASPPWGHLLVDGHSTSPPPPASIPLCASHAASTCSSGRLTPFCLNAVRSRFPIARRIRAIIVRRHQAPPGFLPG